MDPIKNEYKKLLIDLFTQQMLHFYYNKMSASAEPLNEWSLTLPLIGEKVSGALS